MLRRITVLAVLLLSLTTLAHDARASNAYLGAQLGPSFVNNGLGTRFAIGAHGGAKFADHFGLGLYYTYENLASESASFDGATASADLNEHLILAEANLFPLDTLGGLYLGAKVGIGITTFNATVSDGSSLGSLSASGSTTNFAAGPAIGYIGTVVPGFGLGADFTYIFVTTSGSSLHIGNLTFSANVML